MAKYVLRGRYRRKQYKRGLSKRRVYVKRANVNPGIAIRNDNMVWMKRLHRGSVKSIHRPNPNSGILLRNTEYNLRGSPAKRSKNVKFVKNLRGSFKSEM